MSEQELPASTVLQSNTVEAVKLFIESKTRNHEIPGNSGNAMITALNKVFSVEAEPDQVDLSTVDLDDIFARFRIKSVELNDTSFSTYKSRVRRAITMYKKWANGEPWKDASSPRKRNNTRKVQAVSSKQDRIAETDSAQRAHRLAHTRPSAEDAPDGLFDYPIRLVDAGVTAVLRLPPTYTTADADRMAALIRALAVTNSPSASEE